MKSMSKSTNTSAKALLTISRNADRPGIIRCKPLPPHTMSDVDQQALAPDLKRKVDEIRAQRAGSSAVRKRLEVGLSSSFGSIWQGVS
jgi:hypothetical protein